MDSSEQTFIKGCNAGYLMRKHDPALIERLPKLKSLLQSIKIGF